MARNKNNDIKAPDGYLLGGLRRVRSDGTVLFARGWWRAPDEWAGEHVWLHVLEGEGIFDKIELASPGLHIYEARQMGHTVLAERTARDDAAPVFRNPARKAWASALAQQGD